MMDRRFDNDNREKRIAASDGRNVGRVRDLDSDRATVERPGHEESLTDGSEELPGRSDEDETRKLRRDYVNRCDDTKFPFQSLR